MKRISGICCLLAICLLTGCARTDAQGQETISPTETQPETTAVTTTETEPVTTSATTKVETTAPVTTAAETTAETTTVSIETEPEPTETTALPETAPPETEPPATEPPATEPVPVYETFTGILIDQDCSDFDDPPSHDLPCMLMESCRASGYGLDILQADGTWLFYAFDENGQDLALDYLLHTTRMDNLYVTVTGTLTDGTIAVQTLEKLP